MFVLRSCSDHGITFRSWDYIQIMGLRSDHGIMFRSMGLLSDHGSNLCDGVQIM